MDTAEGRFELGLALRIAALPEPDQPSGAESARPPRRRQRKAHRAEVLAERGEMDAALHRLGPGDAAHRVEDLGLGLEHLVGHGVADGFAREPDQPQPLEVVEVGGHPFAVLAPRLGADHVHAARHELGSHADEVGGAHVDGRLGALGGQQSQNPPLVGRELGQDPGVGGVGPVVRLDPGRLAQQLRAADAQPSRSGTGSPRPRRAREAASARSRARRDR